MKSILFPFEISKDNWKRYLYTQELAQRMNAEIVYYTTVAPDQSTSDYDEIYLHLLELNGIYRTGYCKWDSPKLEVETVIEVGEFWNCLSTFLTRHAFDQVVIS